MTTDISRPDPLPDYAAWLDRVTATFQAVSYTCRVRLGDAKAAEAVALRVATGLVARPGVFRHWGLPYSGRIAKLAEDGIAEARAGGPVCTGSWPAFRASLDALPVQAQAEIVLTCVDGLSDEELAARWECSPSDAARHRALVHARLRALAEEHGAVITGPPAGR